MSNTYEHVIVVSNPLKVVKVRTKLRDSENSVKSILPDTYIDLKTGLWNISLDYVIVKSKKTDRQSAEKTIYEIKTSLVTSIELVKTVGTDVVSPHSDFAALGHFQLQLTELNNTSIYQYQKFKPQWFFVDQGSLSYFEVRINEVPFVKTKKPNQLDIELGLLFQRIL
jgi:hypothetical protein